MQTEIKSALVAGAVALVVGLMTVVVQLRVARRSERAARELVELERSVSRDALSRDAFHGLISDGERLRNRCWELAARVRMTLDEPGEDKPSILRELEKAFYDQARAFLDAWGQVAGWRNVALLVALREARHTCMILRR
jgi:hypothetical protein